MLLPDRMISELCQKDPKMIEPFSEPVSGNGIISYGLTSAGYDLRLGPDILTFKNTFGDPVDPKKFKDEEYRARMFDRASYTQGQKVPIPPGGYILGNSFEYLRIPRWLKGRCVGKSTLARCGIVINTTPLEPEWEGHLTLEIANVSPCLAYVYAYEGIAQLEFETTDGICEVSYKDKQGQYDRQGANPQVALVK